MNDNSTRYAKTPPFPSVARVPACGWVFASHPSNVSFRLPAELAHVRHDGGLSAQTILGMRLTRRTAPSDVRGAREACRNASLRKDGVMACFLCFKIIALPAGRTFRPGTLLHSRWATQPSAGYPGRQRGVDAGVPWGTSRRATQRQRRYTLEDGSL
jgi:hypothetical protein